MTFSLESWHVLLAVLAGLSWIYLNFVRPTGQWRADASKQIALLEQRVTAAETRLEKGDESFDRLERTMKDHEYRQQQRNEKLVERLAAIETLLRERGGVPPD